MIPMKIISSIPNFIESPLRVAYCDNVEEVFKLNFIEFAIWQPTFIRYVGSEEIGFAKKQIWNKKKIAMLKDPLYMKYYNNEPKLGDIEEWFEKNEPTSGDYRKTTRVWLKYEFYTESGKWELNGKRIGEARMAYVNDATLESLGISQAYSLPIYKNKVKKEKQYV